MKRYFIASQLPSWIKSLFANSTISIKEEAWNKYPYTKTIYTVSHLNKFLIEIETYYYDEPGLKSNVFNLSEDEQKNIQIDYVDIVKDQSLTNNYIKEEDPLFFQSKKTNRGPLDENWYEEYRDEFKRSIEYGNQARSVMCAYKLIKVQCNVWAIGKRVEKWVDDYARRRFMVEAHKQAWVWMDEWYGLTMDDIRQIEKDTQKELTLKMNQGKKSSRGSICEEIFSNSKKKLSRRSGSVNAGMYFALRVYM